MKAYSNPAEKMKTHPGNLTLLHQLAIKIQTESSRKKKQHTSIFLFSKESVAIMVVMQFPPKLSLRTLVIMEFLYGICERCFSERAMMTWKSRKRTASAEQKMQHLTHNGAAPAIKIHKKQ